MEKSLTALHDNVIHSTALCLAAKLINWCSIEFLDARKCTVSHMFIYETSCCDSRLQKLPQVSPEQMSEQLIQLLEEATCNDGIHDVEIIVSYC